MDSMSESVLRLTEQSLLPDQRRTALADFARGGGWRPSDSLVDYPGTETVASGHIVVEHGLDSSAVLTFLQKGATFTDLNRAEKIKVLSISYNNLTDWHLFPDRHGLTVVNNRESSFKSHYFARSSDPELWRVEAFERISGKLPSPNLKALDDALIGTISLWKRIIASEVDEQIPNRSFAALFNLILLVRAIEDQRTHLGTVTDANLLSRVRRGDTETPVPFSTILRESLNSLGVDAASALVQGAIAALPGLDELPGSVAQELVSDFYGNRFAPYPYDFSLISKQALSRIYERYVSILRDNEQSAQLELFSRLPEEHRSTSLGEVYTPQYVARFFSRFLRENVSPRHFRNLRTIDPACGSGMFLRTLLELQCNPEDAIDLDATVVNAFASTFGVDVDPNACFATTLSLALLHLVLKNQLPSELPIVNAESLSYFMERPEVEGTFDAVIANPPFVKWDALKPEMRDRVIGLLGDDYRGKADLYSAFLILSLRLLSPGGYLLFVLPHSFLLAESNRRIRERLSRESTIRILVDLSEISVFEGIGSYVVLLVCQKLSASTSEIKQKATYAHVRDFPGHALQSVLQQRSEFNDSYTVFEVSASDFTEEPWIVLPPDQRRVLDRISQFGQLADICKCQQGIVTGRDDVFIKNAADVPESDASIWKPFLPDKEITRYKLPDSTEKRMLYPYIIGRELGEEEIRREFAATWALLESNYEELVSRAPVRRGNCEWWQPAWPRTPGVVLNRPRLVSPHLTISPRFGVDLVPTYLVSRTTMIFTREKVEEEELLLYVAAVLNSTVGFWQLLSTSHKYRSGYAMLEKKNLDSTRIPTPSQIPRKLFQQIVSRVRQRLTLPRSMEIDGEVDELVSDAYGLAPEDRAAIGAP